LSSPDRAVIAAAIGAEPERSNRSLAVALGVSHAVVGKVRRGLEANGRRVEHNVSPPEQLLVALLERRRQGESFDDAWDGAFAAIRWAGRKYDSLEWKYALRETKDELAGRL